MKKFFKIVLMTIGGITAAFIALITVFALFVDDGNSSALITFTVNEKKVLVYAPGRGDTNHTSTSSSDEGQIVVRNRKVALRRDGSVLVDDRKLEVGNFQELEVYVHPDQKVETRITRGGS
jgi:hypothetical protein